MLTYCAPLANAASRLVVSFSRASMVSESARVRTMNPCSTKARIDASFGELCFTNPASGASVGADTNMIRSRRLGCPAV